MLARFLLTPLALFLLIATPAAARAEKRPADHPAATISIQQLRVPLTTSWVLRVGTLIYNGRSYSIRVNGLGVSGSGAVRLSASGAVYGLRKLADLPGIYAQVRAGWALGDHGLGTLWLSNSKGVTVRLSTHRKGLQLAIGADGIVIGFGSRSSTRSRSN